MNKFERMRQIMLQVKRIEERIEHLRERAERTTPVLTGMPHGIAKPVSDVIGYMVDLENAVKVLNAEYAGLLQSVLPYIDRLGDLSRIMMRMRYVDRKSVNQIGEAIGYHPRHVRRVLETEEENLSTYVVL